MRKYYFLLILFFVVFTSKNYSQITVLPNPPNFWNYNLPLGSVVYDTIYLSAMGLPGTLDSISFLPISPIPFNETIEVLTTVPCALPYGLPVQVIVKITAANAGGFSINLNLHCTLSVPEVHTVNFTGDVINPLITFNKSSIDFGTCFINSGIKFDTIKLTNTGGSQLFLISIGFLNNSGSFSFFQPDSMTIDPGKSRNIIVSFDPTATGSFSTTLDIPNNSLNNPLLQIPVKANVAIPATISLDKTSIDFGSLGFLEPSVDSIITLTNTSAAESLVISSLYFDNPDSIFQVFPRSPLTIPPNGSQVITIRFSPKEVGNFVNNLHIINSSSNLPNIIIPITGKVIGSTISVTPLTLNFGTVGFQSNPLDSSITITNTGPYSLKFSIIKPTDSSFKLISATSNHDYVIEPGANFNFSEEFNPSKLGSHLDSLIIVSNASNASRLAIDLIANVINPYLSINPSLLNFGSTSVTTPKITSALTITNLSPALKTLNGAALSNITITSKILTGDTASFHFIRNNQNVTLSSGQTDSVIIEFYPHSSGTKSVQLKVTSNDPITPIRYVNLSGYGGGKPVLVSSLNNINFGEMVTGDKKDTTLYIRNDGNLDLNISSKNITGTGSNSFSILSGGNPKVLITAQTDTIKLRATGVLPVGNKAAQLQVISNDSINSTFNINLSAVVKAPELIKDATTIVYDTIDIGNKKDTSFTLKNIGNADLIINYIAIEGTYASDFSLPPAVVAPITIIPNQEYPITVTFKPLNAGLRFARIEILSNDPTTPEASVIIRGNGRIVAYPNIVTSSSSINFGYIEPNQIKDTLVRIGNTGGAILRIDSLKVTGINSASFSVVGASLPLYVNPLDSQNVILRFSKVVSDTSKYPTAKLRIISNDVKNSPLEVSLMAVLEKPKLLASDTVIDFGKITINDSLSKDLTVYNNSLVKININSINIDTSFGQVFSIDKIIYPIQLEPSSSYKFSIKYKPNSSRDYLTYLNIISPTAANSPLRIKLTGGAIKPNITASQSAVDFGYVEVNQFKDSTLIINNTGQARLRIDSLNVTGQYNFLFSVVNKITPIIVNPFGSINLIIRFSPVNVIQNASAKLNIINNDPDNPNLQISLTGNGVKPEISADTILDFGKVTILDSITKQLTVTNSSQVKLRIDGLSFESNDDQAFNLLTTQFPLILGPLASTNIGIQFKPKSNKNYSVYLDVLSNDSARSPLRVKISGTTIIPNMNIPASLSFGRVKIDLSKIVQFNVSNTGSGNLKIDSVKVYGIDSSEFTVVNTIFPVKINAGQKDSISLKFSPKKEGKKSAQIKIFSNDPVNSGEISIDAEGIRQNLSINKSSIDFGDVSVLRTKVDSITLQDQGTENITINTISITGNNASQFTFTDTTLKGSFIINPGASKILTVGFHPDSGGTKTANAEINSSDVLNPQIVISLTGVGLAPAMMVSSNQIDFSNQRINNPKDSIFMISNSGKGILKIKNIYFSGGDTSDFKLISPPLGSEVQPNDKINFIIRFNPQSTGLKKAAFSINSNDNNAPSVSVQLTGTGVQPRLTLSTNNINMGRVFIIKTKDTTFTVTNSGTGTLTIKNLFTTGADSMKFTVLPITGNLTLNPGDTKTITLQFHAFTKGIKNAILVINSDDALNPVSNVSLSGEGIIPKILLDNDLIAEENKDKIINFHLGDNYPPGQIKIFFRKGGRQYFDSTTISVSSSIIYNYTFKSDLITKDGLDFYIKFLWDMVESTLPDSNCVNQPLSLQVNFKTYSNAFKLYTKKYSMITVPLLFQGTTFLNEMIRNLGPINSVEWRIFKWRNNDYEEYIDEDNWQIKVGDGFWLITKENKNIDFQNCMSVPTNLPYKIKLQPGWNQIGSPFLFSVPISSLIIPDNKKVERSLWEWSIGEEDYILQDKYASPWTGYFIKNNENDSVDISIAPVIYQSEIYKVVGGQCSPDNTKSDQSEWKIIVETKHSAESGMSLLDNSSIPAEFGCLKNSDDGWDINDVSEPPPSPFIETRHSAEGGSSVQLRFPHMEWKECKANYIRDFRTIGNKGYTWEMEAISSNAGGYELVFNGLDKIPSQYQFNLYDYDRQIAISSQSASGGLAAGGNSEYAYKFSVAQNQQIKKFKIIVGTKEYIENESQNANHVPREYSLSQNYPNPFNPSTRIEYTIPVNSYVIIKIYNSLGQEVNTLVNKNQQAGRYSVDWHPSNLPSGIYYYRLQTGGFSDTRKMMYVR